MEFCNGSDLKEMMELKRWKVPPHVIQMILFQLVNGFHDMMKELVIHRDLKLQNIMLHFPDETDRLKGLTSGEKKEFLTNVDLMTTRFEIKIADFGFSKKLKRKD